MLDIVVIGRNRFSYLDKCLQSIWSSTENFRLTLIDDYSDQPPVELLSHDVRSQFHQIILNGHNMGSTPSMNTGLHMAQMWASYFNERLDDPLLFIEDDIVMDKDWQKLCWDVLCQFEAKHKIAFIGWDAPEHTNVITTESYVGREIKIKTTIRSSMMYARKSIWKDHGLIPRLNPDGTQRGKPHNGLGSRRELYYLVDSHHSVAHQGMNVATIQNIATHIPEEDSLWR